MITLSSREPSLTGYVFDGRDVIGPSGARHDGFAAPADVLPFLRNAVAQMRPDAVTDWCTRYPDDLVRALHDLAVSMPRRDKDEGAIADAILVWLAAETVGATWAQVLS